MIILCSTVQLLLVDCEFGDSGCEMNSLFRYDIPEFSASSLDTALLCYLSLRGWLVSSTDSFLNLHAII